jgi:lysophospholipase L1-like esterase
LAAKGVPLFRRKSGWILLPALALALALAFPALSWAAARSTSPRPRPVLPPKSATTEKGDSTPVNVAGYPGTIQLACIGDSITAGVGAGNDTKYTARLSAALGAKWEVHNFGVSAATVLKKGNKPYDKLAEFTKAIELKPDVVMIMLGTNDSKPGNWKNKDEFAADYKDMIAQFQKANPKVRIYCCLPIPAYPGKWGINDETIKGQIVPLVRKVAKDTQTDVIDLYTPMIGKGEFVPDTVHPNGDGHAVMAKAIFKALIGTDMSETAKDSGK